MTAWETPVTVAELVDGGPLTGASMYGAGDKAVHGVRIVDALPVFATVGPNTAVVLTGAAASGGWTVEMALRRAWERAAACVIAPAGLLAEAGAMLAERLGVTLVVTEHDPLVTAVEVASAAARPEAARTQLVARCATRLAEAGRSARHILGALNAELPGAAVAFTGPGGAHLAGRRSEHPVVAEVAVLGGTLVARGPTRSPGWPAVVAAVLGLAVAPLTAWAATERLTALHDDAARAALMTRLLAWDQDALLDATALGWPVVGPVTPFVLVAERHEMVPALVGKLLGTVAIAWLDGAWTGWSARSPGTLAGCLERLLEALPFPAAAGVGTPVDAGNAVRAALLGARVAAGAASVGQVLCEDRMGPEILLGALPVETLVAPARAVLADLLDIDHDGVLLRTLFTVLDEGGATKAAARLGVHRNTITLRLERIKAAGFDAEDAPTRLALHLATRILLH